eukprot:1227359-Amphidinium_carterae.2
MSARRWAVFEKLTLSSLLERLNLEPELNITSLTPDFDLLQLFGDFAQTCAENLLSRVVGGARSECCCTKLSMMEILLEIKSACCLWGKWQG